MNSSISYCIKTNSLAYEEKWLWNNNKTKSYLDININTLHSSYFYHLCFPWISELHINLAAGQCCITYLPFFQLVFSLYHYSYIKQAHQILLLLNSKHKKRFMFSATNALMTSFQFKYIDFIYTFLVYLPFSGLNIWYFIISLYLGFEFKSFY